MLFAPSSTFPGRSLQQIGCKQRVLLLTCMSWAQDTKAAKEVQTLADFYAMMGSESARAFYGPAHVLAAHKLGAVQTLLLTDTLLRVNDVALRQRYAKLVEEVGAGGGQVIVFSGAPARQTRHDTTLSHCVRRCCGDTLIPRRHLQMGLPCYPSDTHRMKTFWRDNYHEALYVIATACGLCLLRRHARVRRATATAHWDRSDTSLPIAGPRGCRHRGWPTRLTQCLSP